MMKINILTIFPDMFGPIRESMLGRAIENGIIELNVTDIREFTEDKHRRVDDTPYGGGAGMVMQVQPILDAYRKSGFGGQTIYMSPKGEQLSGEIAREISEMDEITILCGHYEGVDQRVLDTLDAREITIGDYVLTGGELPAMVLIDTVARFIPGVLASEDSALDESVYSGLLEYPHYSKPSEYEGMEVPAVLLSGNHGEVDLWRWEESLRITHDRRPDMLRAYIDKTDAQIASGELRMTKREKAILDKYR